MPLRNLLLDLPLVLLRHRCCRLFVVALVVALRLRRLGEDPPEPPRVARSICPFHLLLFQLTFFGQFSSREQ